MTNTLTVVFGYPGVGKTTTAREIAQNQPAIHLATDQIRKQLFPNPTYSGEESAATYNEMFWRAKAALQEPHPMSVVLDATFNRREGRERAADLADEQNCECMFIRVTCDEAVVRERIRDRSDSQSDADFSVYQSIRDNFDPVERPVEVIDNTA